ncbi:hypothetical protein NMY22_g6087 [Coprinellus aureogranulatus]|nr:hypothetical protein NMY22_g6087 [Coprinellus aureogranulatus]
MEDLGDLWKDVVEKWAALEVLLGYGRTAKTPLPIRCWEWGSGSRRSALRRIFQQQEEEMERAVVSGLTTALVGGAVIAHENRKARRRKTRRKLLRAHLLKNPRVDTPWQALYHSQDDRAFITTMGIDVNTFKYVLNSGFRKRWDDWTIPREDVDLAGQPRVGR